MTSEEKINLTLAVTCLLYKRIQTQEAVNGELYLLEKTENDAVRAEKKEKVRSYSQILGMLDTQYEALVTDADAHFNPKD